MMHMFILKQKIFFVANQHKLNQNNDAVDLELLGKSNWVQFLGQRLRVVNR